MEIERIDDWVGADVVDHTGERVGKLEDLFYAPGSDDPVAASVKTGTLGKSLTLVPLDGAAVTRTFLRIRHAKESLKAGPDVQATTDLATSTVTEASQHYGVELPGGELESGARRKQQAEAAAAARPEA